MSKFDLRDVSERLARSADTEAVVSEFLGYVEGFRADWHASLAFYEVSLDSLVGLYLFNGDDLVRREIKLPVDQLPARLVRKFFHPSAFFNQGGRRSLLAQVLHGSPAYVPDATEASLLRMIMPVPTWQSCACLALADRDDVMALLVIASDRPNAFGNREIGEVVPVKSIAAMAIAQHLHRANRPTAPAAGEESAKAAAAQFQSRIQRLTDQTAALERENRAKSERLLALTHELEELDRNSTDYRRELQRVKTSLEALEEQTAAATEHLNNAYTQLTHSQTRLESLDLTLGFLREVFHVLSQEHDPGEFPRTMVQWFCEHFGLERCSLMVPEGDLETLRIAAQSGMDSAIVDQIRVRVGQGVAGWVAHNRKPLLVRAKEDEAPHTGKDIYNSDSFISVPLIYNDQLHGVLNLSNKREGEPFDEIDLERAMIAGSVLAMMLGLAGARGEGEDEGRHREAA